MHSQRLQTHGLLPYARPVRIEFARLEYRLRALANLFAAGTRQALFTISGHPLASIATRD
jgi:hypothetical protein